MSDPSLLILLVVGTIFCLASMFSNGRCPRCMSRQVFRQSSETNSVLFECDACHHTWWVLDSDERQNNGNKVKRRGKDLYL